MKKIIAMCLILGLFIHSTIAQTTPAREPKTPEEKAEAVTSRLTKRLSLTTEQAAKVKTIQLERFQKIEALKAQYKETDDKVAARSEAKTLTGEADQKMKEALTAEQYTRYEQQRQEQFQKHRERAKSRRSGR